MKIGIVTLPFNSNYGGLIQAFALQSVLKKMDHEVFTVYRITEGMSLKMKILSFGRRIILKTIFRKKVVIRTWPNKNEEQRIAKHTNRFLHENIKVTELFKSEQDFKNLDKYNFDAYVVGSDQVWRPKYSPVIENHFLNFLAADSKTKRISFAASFGVDNWEFSPLQTQKCSVLAQRFNAVSVREDSAIQLCEQNLGVKAVQHVDPTMLVEKEEYIQLVEKDKIPEINGKLVVYVLDLSAEKKKIIQQIQNDLNLQITSTMPEGLFREVGKNHMKKCIFPSVTNWIRGFMDAEFVITDSFHGTVFSIIFNKPFISIGNKKRGMTRFDSLLKMFGLENRLIDNSATNGLEIIHEKIDFNRINKILDDKKKEAMLYMKEALQTTGK